MYVYNNVNLYIPCCNFIIKRLLHNRRLYFLLLLFAFSLGTPGLAQKRCISLDWNFCRISDETSKAEIKNQGSDWSSQYNVQHMDMNGNSELTVPQNTLGAELRQLENKQWEQITLPHTPFVEPLTVLHQWQGICITKKRLPLRRRRRRSIFG